MKFYATLTRPTYHYLLTPCHFTFVDITYSTVFSFLLSKVKLLLVTSTPPIASSSVSFDEFTIRTHYIPIDSSFFYSFHSQVPSRHVNTTFSFYLRVVLHLLINGANSLIIDSSLFVFDF